MTNSSNNLRTVCVWGPMEGNSELHNGRLTQFLFLGPRLLFTFGMKSQQTFSLGYPQSTYWVAVTGMTSVTPTECSPTTRLCPMT